ncbi:MAG: rhomboid family intramembrane serine protease [Deltaproteobacteria bacterium]|nr:rhomboid family intramembrane serine protease [Deltaproteobacteria bacterium]
MASDLRPESGEPAPLDVELLPPRVGRLALFWPALGFGLALGALGWTLVTSLALGTFPYYGVAVLGLVAFALARSLLDRWGARKRVPRVSFRAREVELPRLGSRRTLTLRYDQVSALYIVGRGDGERLFVDGRGQLLVFPRAAFGSAEAFATMSDQLWKRINALPDGAARIAEFSRKSAVLSTTISRPVFATKVLLFSIVAMYILEFGSGAVTRTPFGTPPIGLISLGANARVLLDEGQWFRLITATFLHDPVFGSHLHVLMNAIALFSLGSLLEQIFGPEAIILMFFAGAILGALASAFASDSTMSVGSSTAVLGLFGGLAILALRYRTTLPLVVRQTRSWWTVIVGLNLALPILFPFIDMVGHIGGLIGGALAAFAITIGRPDPLSLLEPPSPRLRIAAAVVAIVCAATGSVGVVRSWLGAEEDELKVLTRMVEDHDASVDLLNGVAYGVGCDRSPSEATLALAKETAERAHAKSKGDPNVGDTLATVLFRLGELDRAVLLERESLASGGDHETFFASQLARFLKARIAHRGPILPTLTSTPSVALEAGKLVIQAPDGVHEDSVMFVLVKKDDELAGLIRARLDRSSFSRIVLELGKPAGPSPELPLDVDVELALYSSGGPELNQAVGATAWGYDPEVRSLPSGIIRPAKTSSISPNGNAL